MSMKQYYRSFADAIAATKHALLREGRVVHVGHWQGVDVKNRPDMATFELLNHSFTCLISPDVDELKKQIQPNLPWADDHFCERVGGVGTNPGEQYKNWPFYRNKANDKHRTERGERFTHTYMERIWPNNTEDEPKAFWYSKEEPHLRKLLRIPGIRYGYGDLNDVIHLLLREPLTRQAFLPIWFPEDTGAVHGGRVPCTLGYHFMLRDNEFHMWYPIRSCDFFRHFRDDIYLACRMLLWVLDKLQKLSPLWEKVRPGKLTMQIYSLHIFAPERSLLERGD